LKIFLQQNYSYGCIKSKEKSSVNVLFRRLCYCKVPEGIVNYCMENTLLGLDTRERSEPKIREHE